MSSIALQRWKGFRAVALDQVAAAHAAVGGTAPGRRYATEQVVHAYAVLLSSHFQGFCRDLHSEATDHIANATTPPACGDILRTLLTSARKLDTGNPHPGNIGADFGRFGFELQEVQNLDQRNKGRQKKLELLNRWRNAIAHQDFSKPNLDLGQGRRTLRLSDVTAWRNACNGLAEAFDVHAAARVLAVVGHAPW